MAAACGVAASAWRNVVGAGMVTEGAARGIVA